MTPPTPPALTAVVTGANRGIGQGFVARLLADGWAVVATARSDAGSRELAQLPRLAGLPAGSPLAAARAVFHPLDVTSDASVAAFARALAARPVHLLVNNAGILLHPHDSVARNILTATFDTNASGPLVLAQALLPNLALAAKDSGTRAVIANVSSNMGSIADNTSGGYYAYRASKAALNAISKSLAIDFDHHHISVIPIHPGYVITDMSPEGNVTVVESVDGMVKLVNAARETPAMSGEFYHFKGHKLVW
ncbi:hypothetical protein HDU82_001540 [Entophlyctis luteolus]|nr:hypothetical protein HDU82_001540 [Entophlyctis luteolus]